MHTDRPKTDPGVITISGIKSSDAPSALQHMRVYEDPAAVDRAWNRLSTTRRPSAGHRPLVQMFAAAALVASGVFVGMLIERSRQVEQMASVESEILLPSAVTTSLPAANQAKDKRPSANRKNRQSADPRSSLSGRSVRSAPAVASSPGPTAELPVEAEQTYTDQELAPKVAVKADWLILAERGDFSAAFQELDRDGGFDAVLLTAGPDELMTLVDVARSVGRQGRAIQALRIVVDQYRDDENAPLAAMMLGNLLSRSGDAVGAAEAFALNRSLSPGGDFAEDALVREFDMAVAAFDLVEAERLRAQYEQEYPDGRHKDELLLDTQRLARQVKEAEDAAAEDHAASGGQDGAVLAEQATDAEPDTDGEAATSDPVSE